MPIDPGLGGYISTSPVPVDPIITWPEEWAPPPTPPVSTPDITSTTATPYRGYYYEIAQNAAGVWLWTVYTGAQQTWGFELIPISGGTSESHDDALSQVTGIIDNLTEDPDFTPPIDMSNGIGLVGVPEWNWGFDPGYVPPTDPDYIDPGLVVNGNGNGALAAPDFALVGLVAVLGALWLFFVRE